MRVLNFFVLGFIEFFLKKYICENYLYKQAVGANYRRNKVECCKPATTILTFFFMEKKVLNTT